MVISHEHTPNGNKNKSTGGMRDILLVFLILFFPELFWFLFFVFQLCFITQRS